ncbi:monocarboxylate transporter 13-like isoform X2 [Saccostrea echinata]|uniref:monocarboxylate transporter 13-like isoform X2 n=1 Tax=Saccostrea echinata TaxID=191078 RepID=UPI002A8200AA|nr:monocarboxylate transporter 13-like isoform X2 [Saccostrea echinata]
MVTMREYYTSPDQGWSWVVLLASFGSHCIHGFFLTAVGILQMSLLDHYKESVFKTSLPLSTLIGLFSISGPFASLVVNKWSCRVSMIAGGLIVSLSLLMTAFMPNIILVFFSLGIFGGVGIGLAFTPSIVVIGYNFEKKRNFASGVAVSGIGIGSFALAPLMQSVSNHYGYHGLMFMCGGLTLHYCVFGFLLFPSKLEMDRKKGERKASNCDGEQLSSKVKRQRDVCRVVSQKALINVYISMFLCNLGIYLVYLHFASYVTSIGFSKLEAAFLFSICGICNCISRILVGSATNANNIDEFLLYAGTFSLTGFTTALFPLYGQTYSGQVFYMVTFGFYSGICFVLLNTICVILAGITNLATVYGLISFFTGIGCFIGPLLGGFIVDLGGTYSQSIGVAGVIIIIGSVFAWGSGVGGRRGKHTKTPGETIVYHESEVVQENLISNIDNVGKIEDYGNDPGTNYCVIKGSSKSECLQVERVRDNIYTKKVKDDAYIEETPFISNLHDCDE